MAEDETAILLDKKPEIPFKCEKCGKEAEVDKKNSNKQWTVFKAACSECGGRVRPIFKNVRKKNEKNKT